MAHILNCQIRSRVYAKERYLVHGYLSKTPSPLSSTQMWLIFFFFFLRAQGQYALSKKESRLSIRSYI